ncbi:MAG: RHS repeat-associated core domain-containing protein, partial [Akkermansia sp.]
CDEDDCDCKDEEGEGSTQPGGSGGGDQSTRNGEQLLAFKASSAGQKVKASANKVNMLWQASFGTFRGLGGVPGGMLEIGATDFSSALWSVKSLTYNHPMASVAVKSKEVASLGAPNTLFKVMKGAKVENYMSSGDGETVFGAGVTGKTNKAARIVSVLGEFPQGVRAVSESTIELRSSNKMSVFYSRATGQTSAFSTWSGRLIAAEEFARYLDIVRGADGTIRQIWNLWDGLANIENVTPSGYTIAFYLGEQVGAKNAVTGLYPVTGTPFKTFAISANEAKNRLVVTERTEGRAPYVCTWWQKDGAWSTSRGTGADEIVTLREKINMGGSSYKIVTTVRRGLDGEAVSRSEEAFTSTNQGTLKDSSVIFGKMPHEFSPGQSIQTDYQYNSQGLRTESRQNNTGTSLFPIQRAYDNRNRQNVTFQPWAGGERKISYTYYRDGAFYDSDIDFRRVVVERNGHATQYLREEYGYSTVNYVRRVEKRTTGLGVVGARLEVTETWQGAAPNPHAQGRLKMVQGIDGIQTHYDYEANTDYGALYKQMEETRVDGQSVLGKSLRWINYVSAEGNTLRAEEYALLTNGAWELTDAADYEYDRENNWIKRTRANGRVAERAMMCCGPLWERDEDGVLTTYSYNTARQLVEIIRSATETTPETIISYTRDAMNRVLEERTDIGSLTKIVKTSYDLMGRPVSRTDELGRMTTWEYSDDGLTVTETTPAGATLITKRHEDGTILERSGSGQRHLCYEMDIVDDGIRIIEKTVVVDNVYPIKQTVVNAVDQVVRQGGAPVQGDFKFERLTYNEKGWLTEKTIDGMAPTLYEYDAFGNVTKEMLKLAEEPTLSNSRITTYSRSCERKEDGIYEIITANKNNGKGTIYQEKESELMSFLSPMLHEKNITSDSRGNETIQWTEYGEPCVRLLKVKVPSSTIIAVARQVDGFITRETDTAGITATNERTINAAGIHLKHTDARGNTILTDKNIIGWTEKITDAAGNATAIRYDFASGNLSCMTDALGKTFCYSYDHRGRKISEWGTALQPVIYGYDNADRLISLTTFRVSEETITIDPASRSDGDTTGWVYHEASGLLLKKCYADGKEEGYTYDNWNRLSSKRQARNVDQNGTYLTSSYSYDLQTEELISISHNDGTPAINYTYNHLGLPSQIIDGSVRHTLSYNEYNELATENTEGLAVSILDYHLDNLGRSAGYALQYGGSTVQQSSLAYDPCGRYSTLSCNQVTTPFRYGYNTANGLLDTLDYPNTFTRWYTRENKRDLLVKIDYLRPGGQNYPAKVDYTYDALGRPITKKDFFNAPNPDLTHSYTYNDRDELVADSMNRGDACSYAYDNIGNRKHSQEQAEKVTAYTANQLNQYSEITEGAETPFTPEYDADGNQTKIKTSTGQWSVVYNALNQATSFTQGNRRIECRYDYMSRRVEKTVYDGENILSRKCFLYNGYLQVAELDASNATETVLPVLRKTYLWDPMETIATRVLVMTTFNQEGGYEEDLYYTHDLLKNTIALFGIKGGRRGLYEYSPYGNILKQEGDWAEENPFRFSSEYSDDELGLVCYNYRYYNPMDGRWISREPVGEMGNANLFSLHGNNTISKYDYLGLYSPCSGKASTTPNSENNPNKDENN